VPALYAYQQLLYHRHRWEPLMLAEIDRCFCGAMRRRPDESGEPDKPASRQPDKPNGFPGPAERDIP
jgi:hypothetical protein